MPGQLTIPTLLACSSALMETVVEHLERMQSKGKPTAHELVNAPLPSGFDGEGRFQVPVVVDEEMFIVSIETFERHRANGVSNAS